MDLLVDSQVLKTMMNIRSFHLKLLKEFIVKLPKEFNDAGSSEYKQVHLRGHCFTFSHEIINDYLRR